MTCAAIGRESPKPTKVAKADNDSSLSIISADSSKSGKSPKMTLKDGHPRNSLNEVKTPFEDKSLQREKTLRREEEAGKAFSAHQPSLSSPLTSESRRLPIPADSKQQQQQQQHQQQQAALSQLISQSGLSSSLLPGAELDRYLRASAGLYGSTFAHPLTCYPALPGLLPSMSYLQPYPQWNTSGTGLPSLAAYSHLPSMSRAAPLPTDETASEGKAATDPAHPAAPPTDTTCNWGNCGKKFASAELMASHVKNEHLGQPAATLASHIGPISHTSSSVPRFSPYSIPGYPRDLLSSRFVYS